MKKLILLIAAMCAAVTLSYADDHKVIITKAELPTVAQKFINTHFSAWKIKTIEKEMELDNVKTSYKVIFKGNPDIEFDQNGNWTDVDGNGMALPMAFLPAMAIDYITKNLPGTKIAKADIDNADKLGREIDVKLMDGRELTFDTQGRFIRIEMRD